MTILQHGISLASPSSSQVQDTGLSRRQHRFESGWGRHNKIKGLANIAKPLFYRPIYHTPHYTPQPTLKCGFFDLWILLGQHLLSIKISTLLLPKLTPLIRVFLRPQLLFLPFAMSREPGAGKILDKCVPCPIPQEFACPAGFIGRHFCHPLFGGHRVVAGYTSPNIQAGRVVGI